MDVKKHCQNLRKTICSDYKKKENFLVDKYGVKEGTTDLRDLSKEDRMRYGNAKIFSEKYEVDYNTKEEPVIVLREGEEMKFDENEAAFLSLGPKFSILNRMCEEKFERELEESIMKFRWEEMGEESKQERKSSSDIQGRKNA